MTSCGPNAIQKWDLATFTHTLYAMRPILSGEEITKTYTDITAPRAIRMAKLQRSYGFSCDCPYCTLPTPEAIARSDAARAELRDWRNTHPTYMKWSKDLCRADDTVIQSHLRALELIDQEGMHGMQGIFLEEIALSYAILGQEVEFRIWAERVVELWKELDPEQSEEYTKYLANPKSFKQWAWRKKQKLRELSCPARQGFNSHLSTYLPRNAWRTAIAARTGRVSSHLRVVDIGLHEARFFKSLIGPRTVLFPR